MATWNAIFLGNFSAELDPIENPFNPEMSEGVGSFVPMTFGSVSDPLYQHVVAITTNNLVPPDDALNTYNTPTSYDEITFDLGGGPITTVYDGQANVGMTVTYTDGTTVDIEARIFQDTSGNLFLAPAVAGDPFAAELAAKPIQQIFTFSNAGHIGNLAIDRLPDNFIVCFAEGTLIDTTEGLRRVETLQVGDMVLTQDHGPQPLRWTGKQYVELSDEKSHLRPIVIAAGALGADLPQDDLRVSPQHRVLVRSAVARRMFDTEEVLVAVKHLVELPGISVDETAENIVYVHLMLDRHEIVFSNGAPTETLFTGPEALKSVSAEARAEILELFPDLVEIGDEMELPEPARPLVSGRKGRKLAQRHLDNDRPLYLNTL